MVPICSSVVTPQKFAYLSTAWTTGQHRFMAGALRYADVHPPVTIRGFSPAKNLTAAVAEIEEWGAQGILSTLDEEQLGEVRAASGRPIPIVNNSLTKAHPNVLMVLADFQGVVETAVNHFRQLGLRSTAFFSPEDGPHIRELLADTFLRIAKPPVPARASLVFPADHEKLYDPHLPVTPVPAVLADWLSSLPKPTGVLSPVLGSGAYLVHCCQALGLRVPEDIAVICGDDMDLSLACSPTLTSITPDRETIGFEAARLLQELVAGKRQGGAIERFRYFDLHVRESTGQRRPEICDIPGALQCIHSHACRGITVAQVIKQTQNVSKATFHRRFQEVVGKSPHEAIRDRKLDEVRRMLTTTDLPLTMVSDLAGFSSAMVLARVFRSAQGVTLSDYRKKHKATIVTAS
jgi:LacI family transcriptional regulator